ncbi:MAG: cupredoxin domain-containing protein, partial [Bradyrhizobium sp.]|nr:cupredoxin domain-containing protein [Bradyrhizobium sp.]
MLRIKLVVAAASLIAAALMVRFEFAPAMPPCMAEGADSIALDSQPFHADFHGDSADDPARVTLRDNPQAVDLVVVDHSPVQADQGCSVTAAIQAVAIAAEAPADTPIVFKVKNLDGAPVEFESEPLQFETVIKPNMEGVVKVKAQKPGRYE